MRVAMVVIKAVHRHIVIVRVLVVQQVIIVITMVGIIVLVIVPHPVAVTHFIILAPIVVLCRAAIPIVLASEIAQQQGIIVIAMVGIIVRQIAQPAMEIRAIMAIVRMAVLCIAVQRIVIAIMQGQIERPVRMVVMARHAGIVTIAPVQRVV
jgi:hypothetical protein